MADEWYYVSQGSELGPVTWETLKQMIARDQLSRNALVKQGEKGRLLLAKRVKGLVDLTSLPLVFPAPTDTNPPVAPVNLAPPRPTALPTISFTPAKPANEIALPPMALPPGISSKSSIQSTPTPSPPPSTSTKTSAPAPAPPAVSAKRSSRAASQLPPAAVPTPPPMPKKVKRKKEIDDLLPPAAG